MTTTQREHWNGDDAQHWVVAQDRYDRQLQPFGEAVIEAAAVAEDEQVLDVGCGCGATTLAVAEHADHAVGLDISAPMLAQARRRAADAGLANVTFVEADAQTHPFTGPGFDVAISRFGVMFFEDPAAAFANIARALRPGGRLAFACWQELAANDWLLVPGLAASAHVSLPDDEPARGPGMFSLADAGATIALLEGAGFEEVTATPFATTMALAGGGTVDETADFLLATGIGKTLFDDAEPAAAAAALDAVKGVLAEHHDGHAVHLGAATWLVTARRA